MPGTPSRLIAVAATLGGIGISALALSVLPGPFSDPLRFAGLVVGAAFLLAVGAAVATRSRPTRTELGLGGAIVGAWVLAAMALLAIGYYLRFPVDFLNFWEGDFIGDLIKLRTGTPLYTEPTENNSSVYTPGAQLLTYGIGRILGLETSIPGLRTIQFSYAILAALFATAATDNLARRLLNPEEYSARPLWIALWFPILVLVATERRFGYNIHALHPDSLTLLISAIAFWLVTLHLVKPTRLVVVALAAIPAIGFWSKQSLLIWGALTGLYLLFSGPGAWRRIVEYGVVSIALLAISLWVLFVVGGPHTRFWIFGVLGAKEVGLARSGDALLTAGGYAALSLAAFWFGANPTRSNPVRAAWGITALLFLVESYTTGIGWQKNHLGPGVLLAASWALAVVPRLFHAAGGSGAPAWAKEASVLVGLLLTVGGLGLTRLPKNGVPADTERYIAAIEAEFTGMNPREVLLDRGNWVYFPDSILMPDRASSVQLWVGKNQRTINHEMLQGTIRRFQERRYRRVLVRNLDEGSAYDFQERGSGVRDALLANYREVRRIPGVKVDFWWPQLLLADISVLEPIP